MGKKSVSTATAAQNQQAGIAGDDLDNSIAPNPDENIVVDNEGANQQQAAGAADQDQNAAQSQQAGQQHALTLDELLAQNPAIKSEYDRKMQAAIAKHDARKSTEGAANAKGNDQQQAAAGNSAVETGTGDNQQPEKMYSASDIEKIVAQQVTAQVNVTKFNACLDRTLEKAGITDKTGYLAHIDMQDLYDHYDPKTDSIEGYTALEAEMRKDYPYYFGTQAGGKELGTFGGNSGPVTLRGALGEKFNIKK